MLNWNQLLPKLLYILAKLVALIRPIETTFLATTHSIHHFPLCFNYSCLISVSSAPECPGSSKDFKEPGLKDKRTVMLAFNWILKPHNWNRKASSQILTSASISHFHSTGNKSVVKISPKVICAKQVGCFNWAIIEALLPSIGILKISISRRYSLKVHILFD